MDVDNIPPLNELSSEQKDILIIELVALVKSLQKKVIELEQKVADLESRLNRNSKNSHTPPSTDKFSKASREKSNKPRGGQVGHQGHTLQFSKTPDHLIDYSIDTCSYCQTDLKNTVSIGYKTAQVFDIPVLKINVTEHRVFEKICPHCHLCCSAQLPADIRFGPQYGPHLRSLVIYLHHYHYLASHRIVEFFEDIFNHSISEGVIFSSEKEAYKHLEQFDQDIKELLKTAKIAHADETSLRVNGKNEWLHVVSTADLTSYFIHPKRGKKATDEMGILPDFKGTLIHDDWKSYFQYECSHAPCHAHHLRELQGVFEGTHHEWPNKMADLLKEINKAKEENNIKDTAVFESRYTSILDLGFKEALQVHERSPPLKKSFPKEICLLERLKNRARQALAFMYDKDIPFTNNQAERDLRMMKVKMKVSGCFRERLGAQVFCRIRGYMSTMKKNGTSILYALTQALNGNPCSAF